MGEAFTGSRKPSIEYNLSDFRANPIFGKGFQVIRGMEQAYRSHLITWYSASVEKGVTPYVILGETGLMGATTFVVFLCVFYSTCPLNLERENCRKIGYNSVVQLGGKLS